MCKCPVCYFRCFQGDHSRQGLQHLETMLSADKSIADRVKGIMSELKFSKSSHEKDALSLQLFTCEDFRGLASFVLSLSADLRARPKQPVKLVLHNAFGESGPGFEIFGLATLVLYEFELMLNLLAKICNISKTNDQATTDSIMEQQETIEEHGANLLRLSQQFSKVASAVFAPSVAKDMTNVADELCVSCFEQVLSVAAKNQAVRLTETQVALQKVVTFNLDDCIENSPTLTETVKKQLLEAVASKASQVFRKSFRSFYETEEVCSDLRTFLLGICPDKAEVFDKAMKPLVDLSSEEPALQVVSVYGTLAIIEGYLRDPLDHETRDGLKMKADSSVEDLGCTLSDKLIPLVSSGVVKAEPED